MSGKSKNGFALVSCDKLSFFIALFIISRFNIFLIFLEVRLDLLGIMLV